MMRETTRARRLLPVLAAAAMLVGVDAAAGPPACCSPAGRPGVTSVAEPRGGVYTDIDNAALKRLRANGAVVVDIRRPDEWRETGVIDGSRLITLFTDERGSVNPGFMPTFSRVASPDDPVVIVCRTGNRSNVLADALARQMGYTKVYNLRHGIVGWIGAGNGVVAPR